MYKLLPPEEKSKVEHEYHLRLSISALTLVSSLALFTILALLPSLILAKSAKDNTLYALENARPASKDASDELKTWAQDMRLKLASLAEDKADQMPYEWIMKVLAIKPSGVKITNFFFQTGKILTIRIHGIAKTRQILLDFQTSINQSGVFGKVDFPVSALAEDSDLNFDFSLTPAP